MVKVEMHWFVAAAGVEVPEMLLIDIAVPAPEVAENFALGCIAGIASAGVLVEVTAVEAECTLGLSCYMIVVADYHSLVDTAGVLLVECGHRLSLV